MAKLIYGGDTETVRGKPLTLQFYSEDGKGCNDIIFVDEKTALKKFLEWCGKRERNTEHVVYIHKLSFDMLELFWGMHEKLIGGGGEFEFSCGGWHVRGIYGSPTFCRISDRHERVILLVDSLSFYRGSLASAAQLYCPDLPKLARPRGLGEHRYTSKDTAFCAYAMRDAEVAYHIGVNVDALHREFDVKQCVSIADLSARIFRHRFLTYTIPQPSIDVIEASLLSYHGGKNNLAVPAGWYTGVSSLDISSAYPHAMHEMPAFSCERLYKRFKAKGRVKDVPAYGVYCVAGSAAKCTWPCVFTPTFKAISGRFSDVWIQGHEVNEALQSDELKISYISGFFYDAEKDIQAPAFRGFLEEFYRRKQQAKTKVLRYGYKMILTNLYGKFIQTRKKVLRAYVDIDSGEVCTASELVAGGLFHPFIATATTAHTRARIHQLEHAYSALHTATDGIFTQSTGLPRSQNDVLGGVVCEVQNGELCLIRNKCYILYAKEGIPSQIFKGKKIAKEARHGFQGNVTELERLVATGRRKYKAMHVNQLKESLKRGLTPNEFVERDYTLKIGSIPVQGGAT